MAKEALQTLSGEAAADLSASQFCAVLIDTSGNIALCGVGATNIADGVLQDKPTALGMACSYAIGGVTKIKAGAALGDGVTWTTDSAGRAIAATSTDFVFGKTRTAAGAADEIIEATFQPRDIMA